VEKYADMPLAADTMAKLFFGDADDPKAAFEASVNGIKHEIIEANLINALGIKVDEDEILNTAKYLTSRQFAQYGMAGIDDEIITRYAKEQLQKEEVRNQITRNVLQAKLYEAIENAVTLDEQVLSLDEFKKLANA
ncbi:MAG: hypothetical protein K2K55_08655, partial [Duncaniella sp.]|nr:hypothetical protein [Duncaniella sp.]